MVFGCGRGNFGSARVAQSLARSCRETGCIDVLGRHRNRTAILAGIQLGDLPRSAGICPRAVLGPGNRTENRKVRIPGTPRFWESGDSSQFFSEGGGIEYGPGQLGSNLGRDLVLSSDSGCDKGADARRSHAAALEPIGLLCALNRLWW